MLRVWIIFLFACPAVFGATYYIDNYGGSDATNGTSTASPWKHHPYMAGWTGSYSHSAGDQFIFKGGVVWTNANASGTMVSIAAGGTSGAWDYYGVSNSWYVGGSWSRPCFDGGHHTQRIIDDWDANYITFDSLELKGIHATGNASDMSINLDYTPTYILMTNLLIHDWTYEVASDGQFGGVRHYLGATALGTKLTHCDIGNPEHSGNSGTCVYNIDEIEFCKLHDSPQGVLHGGRLVHDNEIYDIRTSYDGAQHPNMVFLDNPVGGVSNAFWNNYCHGTLNAMHIYLVGDGRGTGAYWVWNNVIMSTELGAPPMITVDIDSGHSTAMSVYIYNNTFSGTNGAIDFTTRASGSYDLADAYNNHWIGTGTPDYSPATTYNSGNEVVQTIATANSQGYTVASVYAPTSAGGSTVGAGTNLTSKGILAQDTSLGGTRTRLNRPAAGAWDVGAYMYTNIPAPYGVKILSAGTLGKGTM